MEGSGSGEILRGLLSASDFLKYGPIGLAGLLLVLVIFALATGNVTAAKERVLKICLYVGAFCLVVCGILAAIPSFISSSHMLYLRIEPLDLNISQKFPPPVVTINSQAIAIPVKYKMDSDITAIIDVTAAIKNFDDFLTAAEKQQNTIENVVTLLGGVQADLADQRQLAVNDSCSGGPSGIPTNHSVEITTLNAALSQKVGNIQGLVDVALEQKSVWDDFLPVNKP